MTAAATPDTLAMAAEVDDLRRQLALARREADTLAARGAGAILPAEAKALRQEAADWRRMFADAGTVVIGFMDQHRQALPAGVTVCDCDHCEAARRVVFRPAGDMAKRGKG